MTPTRPISLETVSRPARGGPNTPRDRVSKSLVLFAIVAATTLAAAAPRRPGGAEDKKKTTKGKSGPAAVERVPVWPLPPEPARIRYVTSYRGADDFNTKKKSSGWKALVFGQDDAGPARSRRARQAVRRGHVAERTHLRDRHGLGPRLRLRRGAPERGVPRRQAAGKTREADRHRRGLLRARSSSPTPRTTACSATRPQATWSSPSAATANLKAPQAWRSTATASGCTWPTPRSTRCSATRPSTAPPSGPSAAAAASPASSTSRRTSPSTRRGDSM